MCFYCYSKETQIEIRYATEAIRFFGDGSSEVSADILIQNIGESNLNNLFFLYPNRFFSPSKAKDSFQNITSEISDVPQYSQENYYYRRMHYEFLSFEKTIEVSPNCKEKIKYLTLKHPYAHLPIHVEQHKTLYGDLTGRCDNSLLVLADWQQLLANYYAEIKNTNVPVDEELRYLVVKMNSILEEERYSLFSLQLKYNLPPNENVWVRLKFRPIMPPYLLGRKTKYHLTKLVILNELYYTYEITSPYGVFYRFNEKIAVRKYIAQQKCKEEGLSHKKKEDNKTLNALCEFLLWEIGNISGDKKIDFTKISHTKYDIWQLHLYPYQLRVFFQFFSNGNIEPCGDTPDVIQPLEPDRYISDKSTLAYWKYTISYWLDNLLSRRYKHRIYKWISKGTKNESDKEKSFSLRFLAKKHHRILELIPFAVLTFVVFWVIFNFYGFRLTELLKFEIVKSIWDFLLRVKAWVVNITNKNICTTIFILILLLTRKWLEIPRFILCKIFPLLPKKLLVNIKEIVNKNQKL